MPTYPPPHPSISLSSTLQHENIKFLHFDLRNWNRRWLSLSLIHEPWQEHGDRQNVADENEILLNWIIWFEHLTHRQRTHFLLCLFGNAPFLLHQTNHFVKSNRNKRQIYITTLHWFFRYKIWSQHFSSLLSLLSCVCVCAFDDDELSYYLQFCTCTRLSTILLCSGIPLPCNVYICLSQLLSFAHINVVNILSYSIFIIDFWLHFNVNSMFSFSCTHSYIII